MRGWLKGSWARPLAGARETKILDGKKSGRPAAISTALIGSTVSRGRTREMDREDSKYCTIASR
jgi:hypothetical protein